CGAGHPPHLVAVPGMLRINGQVPSAPHNMIEKLAIASREVGALLRGSRYENTPKATHHYAAVCPVKLCEFFYSSSGKHRRPHGLSIRILLSRAAAGNLVNYLGCFLLASSTLVVPTVVRAPLV